MRALTNKTLIPGHHHWLGYELPELRPHLQVVMIQQLSHLLHGEAGGQQLGPDHYEY